MTATDFGKITAMETAEAAESNETAIEAWTKDEKFRLLQALKVFGSQDIERIHDNITTKSPEEISTAINYYKGKIKKRSPNIRKKKESSLASSRIPLASWAKFLTSSLSYEELRTETSTAIKLIAELETIPPPVCTDNIDFRLIYQQIADAMDGKEIITDNRGLNVVLNKCIVETALTSKAFMRNTTYKNIVNSINISDKAVNVFPRPTKDNELMTLRHLASQRSYNPLNIPEEYLKPAHMN